jgi:hypothetical protein
MDPQLAASRALSFVINNILPSISCVILLTLITPSAALAADGDLAGHPALAPFDLTGEELPSELFLVRTRGELPEEPGVVVHGAYKDVHLVSGDAAIVLRLAESGCAVIPLTALPTGSPPPYRQWTRIDTPDPAIAAMVAQVNWTAVSSRIQWLVDFGTRYSYAPNHFDVADAIAGVLKDYGLEASLSSFQYGGATMWNVEAVQIGTVHPDSFYVLCGHFDATSEASMVSAPGADDNGTGVATVLTAAEILTQHDFEYSIRYICFGGEEQGLRGSQAYASWAAQNSMGIVGVLNFDMMGYWEPGRDKDLEIETNQASQWLAAAITNAANLYTGALYELHVFDGAWWGDHASFWDNGYAAVNHEEAWDWGDPDFNPYYHSTNDLLTHIDADFTVGNIQIGVAALATLAGYVPDVTGVGGQTTPPTLSGTIRAYPNPFDGRITLSVSGLQHRERTTVLIYDARGRRVGSVPVTLVDVIDMTAGVYFGRLQGVPGAEPAKIVYVK